MLSLWGNARWLEMAAKLIRKKGLLSSIIMMMLSVMADSVLRSPREASITSLRKFEEKQRELE